MATEYKLSYTANDINTKLGKIDNLTTSLATKQNILTFDEAPTDGSSNPVTSSGIKTYINEQIVTKQDKLAGTAGQMVGFDESGNAVAQGIVQPDWNQNDETAADYIKNKPSTESFATKKYVDDEIDTITADSIGALPNTTVIPTVPTNISAFANDSGYLTSYTETDPTVPAWAKASSKPTYTASEVGALPNTTVIPSSLSDLTTDSNHRLVTDTEKETWNGKSDAEHEHSATDITSGTLSVARGGTGATTFTSGQALIGAGTGAVTTRTITNNTSTSSSITGSTNLVTMNTLRYALNRTSSVATADTSYTTYMARGESLNDAETNPTVNGTIAWVYE